MKRIFAKAKSGRIKFNTTLILVVLIFSNLSFYFLKPDTFSLAEAESILETSESFSEFIEVFRIDGLPQGKFNKNNSILSLFSNQFRSYILFIISFFLLCIIRKISPISQIHSSLSPPV